MPTTLTKPAHDPNSQAFASKDLKTGLSSCIVGFETLDTGAEFDRWASISFAGVVVDFDVF